MVRIIYRAFTDITQIPRYSKSLAISLTLFSNSCKHSSARFKGMGICEVRCVLALLIAVPPMIRYEIGLALCESDSIMGDIVASRGGSEA